MLADLAQEEDVLLYGIMMLASQTDRALILKMAKSIRIVPPQLKLL